MAYRQRKETKLRLSDVKGERVFDVIAEIIDPIAEIAGDEQVTAPFNATMSREEFVQALRTSVPRLVGAHRDALCTILGSIQGVTKDEYLSTLTMQKLITDVYEVLTDDELMGFFA